MLQSREKCPQIKEWSSRGQICGKLFDNAGQTIFYDFFRAEARGQGHRDLDTKCDTPQLQDVSAHQTWDSYLK